MKNRLKFILIVFALIFVLPLKVNAVGICPAKQISKYRTDAQKIKFSYELYKVEEEQGLFYVTATNVNPNIVIEFEGIEYRASNDSTSIKIEETFLQNREYKFNIRTNDDLDICPRAYLTTKTIKTPKYNPYSELDVCIEYEEFPLCHKYYSGEIKDYNEFNTKLKEFINDTKSDIPPVKDDRNIFQILIDLYMDNIEISVAITTLIVLIILLHIGRKIYRKSKRIKIDM